MRGAGVGHLAAAVGAEAERAGLARAVHDLAPARPQALEGRHHQVTRPGAGPGHDLLAQLVDRQAHPVQRVPDRRHDLARLFVRDPDAGREGARAGRDRGQGGGPQGEFPGGEQMDRAARAVGLHQGAVLPERGAYVRPGQAGAPDADRQLGRGQHLGVRAEHRRDDVGDRGALRRRIGQELPFEPPRARLVPGDRHRHRATVGVI